MDHYKTWLSALKNSLAQEQLDDDETLRSTIAIAVSTFHFS
jgi:hypothetical protein